MKVLSFKGETNTSIDEPIVITAELENDGDYNNKAFRVRVNGRVLLTIADENAYFYNGAASHVGLKASAFDVKGFKTLLK